MRDDKNYDKIEVSNTTDDDGYYNIVFTFQDANVVSETTRLQLNLLAFESCEDAQMNKLPQMMELTWSGNQLILKAQDPFDTLTRLKLNNWHIPQELLNEIKIKVDSSTPFVCIYNNVVTMDKIHVTQTSSNRSSPGSSPRTPSPGAFSSVLQHPSPRGNSPSCGSSALDDTATKLSPCSTTCSPTMENRI